MKYIYKIALSVLLMSVTEINLNAQALGINLATPQWYSINHIIERYNETRPWLDNKMNEIHYVPGINFSFLGDEWDSRWAVELFRYQYMRRSVSASGNNDKRTLIFTCNSFSIAGGTFYPVKGEKLRFGIGAYPMELHRFKFKSKLKSTDTKETLFKSSVFFGIPIVASSTVHADLSVKLNDKRNMTFRVYYLLDWFQDEDILPVNSSINPNTYETHYQSQIFNMSHLGFTILYVLQD
ncbi:MAG: hypothetical protein Fur0041_06040 [Bacteroidia bacterium]